MAVTVGRPRVAVVGVDLLGESRIRAAVDRLGGSLEPAGGSSGEVDLVIVDLGAVPDPAIARRKQHQVPGGDVPSPTNPPPACRYHTRCPKMQQLCAEQEPPLEEKGPDHFVACYRSEEIESEEPALIEPEPAAVS